MKFWERITSREDVIRQLGKANGSRFWLHQTMLAHRTKDNLTLSQIHIESHWEHDRKPYYNVWPTIVPLLLRINLDFAPSAWRMPAGMKTLCVRLPEKGVAELPDVRSILFEVLVGPKGRNLSIWVDIGEKINPIEEVPLEISVMTFLMFPLDEYETIQKGFDDQEMNAGSLETVRQCGPADEGILLKCLKLITTLAILEDDPQLIRPDALAKEDDELLRAFAADDQEKVKLISERAFRRRGPGWHVGQMYEPGAAYIVPPHPQRYHVGKGRERVIVKVRKGYEVKGDEFRKVPTGYEEQQGAKVPL